MTTMTEDEFAVFCLKTPGLYGAEETPTSADIEWMKSVVGSEIAMLAAIGMPIWNGSELSVPLEYQTALARRVVLAVQPSFGRADISEVVLAMREAERPLTLMAAPRASKPLQLRTDDYGSGRTTFNFTTGR